MDVKLIVAIFVFAVVPVCAHAQTPSDAKVTKAEVQKVVKMITDDKARDSDLLRYRQGRCPDR